MDQKISPEGRVTLTLVPVSAIADFRAPTQAELNGGSALNVSPALAWDGTTLPAGTESDDVDDRAITDKGNATSRGSAQYEGTLNFFHPRDKTDMTNVASQVYDFLRIPGVPVYAITRLLQAEYEDGYEEGEWISVYRFLTDSWEDDIEGDDSYKYAVGMLTQGEVVAYTQVANIDPITIANASGSDTLAVGEHAVIRAEMGGHRATQTVNWESSNPSVASVSRNGVVTANDTGTADIKATHPAAPDSTAIEITVQ